MTSICYLLPLRCCNEKTVANQSLTHKHNTIESRDSQVVKVAFIPFGFELLPHVAMHNSMWGGIQGTILVVGYPPMNVYKKSTLEGFTASYPLTS